MARTDNVNELPAELLVPMDDGACAHLQGLLLPTLALASTAGRSVNLARLPGLTMVYVYPRISLPDRELHEVGVDNLFGCSTEDTEYQREAVERLHLPFEFLSDEKLEFAQALKLPTSSVDGMTLIKRLTLILRDGAIEQVFYPVFPPDSGGAEALEWCGSRQRDRKMQGFRSKRVAAIRSARK